MNAPQLDPEEQKVVDDIRDYGCHIVHVPAERAEDIDFSYTVGFPVSVGQPEAIVFGIEPAVAQSMLNEVLRQCRAGLQLADGVRLTNLLQGFDCIARRIDRPEAIREHFGWALWYHHTQRGNSLNGAFQIVWPGALQGLFPWQAGCHASVCALQPALYRPGPPA